MSVESRLVQTRYGRFYVESTGEGKPVLFIHGAGASAREWRWVLTDLGRHARCVAIDCLGCGESDRSPAGYGRDTITRAILELADALGFDRFGVVGQSFGGFWASSLAFAAPERISRLVLVNTLGALTAEQNRQFSVRAEAIRGRKPWAGLTDDEREQRLNQSLEECFHDQSRVPPSFRELKRWQMSRADPHVTAALGEGHGWLGEEDFGRINCPSLVIWGEGDAMFPSDAGKQIADAVPGARYAGLPGVGHTCQIEDPAGFVAALAPFLDETAGS